MKYIFAILMIALPTLALAAGGEGHGDPHAIPVKMIVYQTINIVILLGGAIYFLREPVRKFFKERQGAFVADARKAEDARNAAEQQRADIQLRLQKLESTADESISRAKVEAADMKKQLIAEADAISKRIREEAEEAARIEVEKAKGQLRDTLIQESLKMARSQITTKVTPEDHQRLQSDFINHIQAVQK